MKVFRYKLQADSGLVDESVRQGQSFSHLSDDNADYDSVVEFSNNDVNDVVNNVDDNQTIKPSIRKNSAGNKKGRLLCAGGLLLALIISATIGGYVSAKKRSAVAAASAVFCQPPSIKDTKEPILELTLFSGMERLVDGEEAKILERAVMDGYNEASGGCTDAFERWIYGTFICEYRNK
jgi:hypothetical protein